MTSLIRGFVGSLSDALDLNQATLSGCIDIIIVEHEDGSRHSTPFHVRFGKLQLLRSREKLVTIYVNGEKTPLTMKLGRAGEAYFYEQFETDTDGEWSSSPLQSPLQSPVTSPEKYIQTEFDDEGDVRDILEELVCSVERFENESRLNTYGLQPQPRNDSDSAPFSADEVQESSSISAENDLTQKADPLSELPPPLDLGSPAAIPQDVTRRSKDGRWSVWSWGWGSLPVRKLTASSSNSIADNLLDLDSIYMEVPRTSTSSSVPLQLTAPEHAGRSLSWVSSFIGIFRGKSDTTSINLDPPMVDVRLFVTKRGHVRIKVQPSNLQTSSTFINKIEEQVECQAEPLPCVVQNVEAADQEKEILSSAHCVELSLCAQFFHSTDDATKLIRFRDNLIHHDRLCSDPFLIFDPNLVVRYQELFYPGKTAIPLILSYLAFGRPLTPEAMDKLQVPSQSVASISQHDPNVPSSDSTKSSFLYRWFSQDPANDKSSAVDMNPVIGASSSTLDEEDGRDPNFVEFSVNIPSRDNISEEPISLRSSPKAPSHKTLRPTSDMLRMLNLNFGQNVISFCVESALQGMQLVEGFIYLWPESTKIVISDVDGTITRSDLLGNIMPLMGKDWSQVGVTSFFSNIVANGYNILYLTSRAIGQANVTRAFLSSIKQGAISLPQGPVIMSPDSLISSFKREVIYRRPQEFKIPALRDVANLFPEGVCPFVAGFGNRDTDIESYIAVGIPLSMIFIIDPKGSIHRMKSIHRTSYSILNDQVEHMFPPFNKRSSRAHSSFSEFHYWREPIRSLKVLQQNAYANELTAERKLLKTELSIAETETNRTSAKSNAVR